MTIQTNTPRIQTQRAKFSALLAALLLASIAPAVGADAATEAAATAETAPQSVTQPSSATGTKSAGSQTMEKQQGVLRAYANRAHSPHEEWMETMGISLGFVTVVLGIGIAFFAIWADYRKRHELLTICHQERMAALDKGLELPPFPTSLVNSPEDLAMLGLGKEPARPGNGLKSGLLWLGIGAGGTFAFDWKFSAILIGIGVAYLIHYAIEGRKLEAGKNGSQK